jgi:RNA polymerase sigma-70 factor (ECF subfamily)
VSDEPSPREAAALALYPAVFRFALHLTRHWHDAEDVTQTAYLRALPHLAGLDDRADDDLKPWLLTVCRSVWLDEIRRRDRRPQSAVLLDMHTTEGPYDLVVEVLHARSVLDAMPTVQAQALIALSVYGYTGEQWAEATRTPLGTVKQRVRLGRARFRREWEAA